MKMRRFFAPTMSQALKQVRREQGSSAVILSQRKVEGGVEVVAAVDPDMVEEVPEVPAVVAEPQIAATPAMHHSSFKHRPAAEQRPHLVEATAAPMAPNGSQEMQDMRREMQEMRALMEQHLSLVKTVSPVEGDPQQAWLSERLDELGISEDICQQIWQAVQGSAPNTHWQQALNWLEQQLPMGEDKILQQGGVIALVGPTGVGKTTTAAKLAARYALRNGTERVALVTTDAFRIGAQEQLRAFGSLIGVPVYAVSEISELHETLHALSDRDLVIIDTAGLSQRDMQLLEQLAVLRTGEIKIDPYLVVSATTQERALNETVEVFNRIELEGVILSKLDEGGELGGALSVMLRHGLPLLYLGDGQRVPEDLQVARGRDLVDQLVSQKGNNRGPLTLVQGGLNAPMAKVAG